MLDKNRGQVGESVTWIVATLIIVIILTISILLTKFVVNPEKITTYSTDRQENMVAMSSITSFLESKDTQQLLAQKDYPNLKIKVSKFLQTLPHPPAYTNWGWNFQLTDGNQSINIQNLEVPGNYDYFDNTFIFNSIKLRFWLICEGNCR